jgi:hypothetical protein
MKKVINQLILFAIIAIPIFVFVTILPFSKTIKPMWVGITLDVASCLVVIFALQAILRRLGILNPEDIAPGWQTRYTQCGFIEPYGKYGIRIGHNKGTWYRLGWCSQCHGFHRFTIENTQSN